MKKYLFLVTDNYPFGYGEEFIQNEVEYLSKSFKKIFIITNNNNDKLTKEIPKNFEVFRITKNKLKLFELLKLEYLIDFFSEKQDLKNIKRKINFIYIGHIIKKRILEILENENIELNEVVLYSYWFYSGAYAISKIESKNILKISRAHRYDLYKESGPQFLKEIIFKNINWILPCSFQGEVYLKKEYLNFKSKIKCSYLGTKNNKKFRLKENNYNLVSCSYIRPIKRIDLIIEALAQVDLKNKKVTWTHIGDGENLKQIKLLAEQRLKNIEFKFLGNFENKKILNYYEENDIKCFINLSSSEGLPVSMMEVQSFGVPIIATNVGGVSEIVNSETGILLVENPTSKEVAKAIEKIMLLSDEGYKKIQQNCYDNWNKKFNADKNYEIFIKKYLKGFKNEE